MLRVDDRQVASYKAGARRIEFVADGFNAPAASPAGGPGPRSDSRPRRAVAAPSFSAPPRVRRCDARATTRPRCRAVAVTRQVDGQLTRSFRPRRRSGRRPIADTVRTDA